MHGLLQLLPETSKQPDGYIRSSPSRVYQFFCGLESEFLVNSGSVPYTAQTVSVVEETGAGVACSGWQAWTGYAITLVKFRNLVLNRDMLYGLIRILNVRCYQESTCEESAFIF